MNQETLTELMNDILTILAPGTLVGWESRAPAIISVGGISFGDVGIGEETGFLRTIQEDSSSWPILQANLPPDLHIAAQMLNHKWSQIQRSDQILAHAQARIGAITNMIAGQEPGQAFGLTALPVLDMSERELLAAVAEIEMADDQVDFGLGDKLADNWEGISAQIKTYIDSLLRQVVYNAWVETRVENKILGRTVVAWTGGANTYWPGSITADEIKIHERTLEIALVSRLKLVRLMFLAVDGAFKLSLILSAPSSVILVLPAIWKYVNQILDELARNQT
ncbi:MAG: hypothetical protein EXR62_05880 [Chloroflexi bacterium]|nr:hypothetical protein [Chloroflexota bacterium]